MIEQTMRPKKKALKKVSYFRFFLKSIWLFPAICTLVLILLSALRISGTSIGVYDKYFYGPSYHDSNLLLNEPRDIRSDEWLVNTQMTIAQSSNDFSRINNNIGNGQDMSLVLDVPYEDWSAIFKPHNLGFLVLPLEYAFALKWWIMGYLLILSCYFFSLAILPNRRLFAALISLALFFSPFIQWWYQYITLGPIYYALFSLTVFIQLLRSQSLKKIILWTILLTYLITSFALVLYPPFQIAVAIVAVTFAAAFLARGLKDSGFRVLKPALAALGIAFVVSSILIGLFIASRYSTVKIINNTVYPGHRAIASGHYDGYHLLSSHLSFQNQFGRYAGYYHSANRADENQSEASNFILLAPYLIIPALIILVFDNREKKPYDIPLIAICSLLAVLMVRLFVPYFSSVYKILALDKVPQNRLLIAIGFLNLILLILVSARVSKSTKKIFSNRFLVAYISLIFIVEVLVGIKLRHLSPAFISPSRILLLSIPIPIVIYFLLRGRLVLASLILFGFSLFSSAGVHPLYRSLDVVTNTPISSAIRAIHLRDKSSEWVMEGILMENFGLVNGVSSLSGVHTYPQPEIWEKSGLGSQKTVYNRYAHISFTFDRDPSHGLATSLNLVGADHFDVSTEPCGFLIKNSRVHYLVSEKELPNESCLRLIQKVAYPNQAFYIYRAY